MKTNVSLGVFGLVLWLALASCTLIQETPGGKWTGTGIGFDANYSFGQGYYIGSWELDLGFAYADGTIQSYWSSGAEDDVLLASGQTFTKTIQFSGETIEIKGNFVTAGRCEGSTTYRGKTLNWVALPE